MTKEPSAKPGRRERPSPPCLYQNNTRTWSMDASIPADMLERLMNIAVQQKGVNDAPTLNAVRRGVEGLSRRRGGAWKNRAPVLVRWTCQSRDLPYAGPTTIGSVALQGSINPTAREKAQAALYGWGSLVACLTDTMLKTGIEREKVEQFLDRLDSVSASTLEEVGSNPYAEMTQGIRESLGQAQRTA